MCNAAIQIPVLHVLELAPSSWVLEEWVGMDANTLSRCLWMWLLTAHSNSQMASCFTSPPLVHRVWFPIFQTFTSKAF